VLRIDPTTNAVTATIAADDRWGIGYGIASYDGAVWAGCLVRIDPATDKVAASHRCEGADQQGALAFGAGSVWIADSARVHQIPLAAVR
jgi:streptogramin lyase